MTFRVQHDSEAEAYRVQMLSDGGELAMQSRAFKTFGEAQAYMRACEGGKVKFAEDKDNPGVVLESKQEEPPNVLNRTAAGLRDILFDEIAQVRAGKTDEARLKAISSAASQIVSITRLELDYARMLKENPELKTYDAQRLKLGGP